MALCQFLPGPASSQTAITIGILRAGLPGAFAAWLGFTAPSAVAMILFGYGVAAFGNLAHAALAARAQDRRGRGRRQRGVGDGAQSVPRPPARHDRGRRRDPGIGGAVLGRADRRHRRRRADRLGVIAQRSGAWGPGAGDSPPLAIRLPRALSVAAGVAFVALLIGLPVLAAAAHSHALALFAAFYRSGALVFGGGHVVLPLAASRGGAARMGRQ